MIKYFTPPPLKGEKVIRSSGAKGVKCDRIQGGGYPPLTDGCGGGVGNIPFHYVFPLLHLPTPPMGRRL